MESFDIQKPAPSQDEKNLALLSHIGTLFGSFVVPLVIYLVKKDESEFVTTHAKESLNFQISLFLYMLGSMILMLIFIGIILVLGLAILSLIGVIMASIAASNGQHYKYPLTIRFLK